jgi:hypothetical protein
MIDKVFTSFLAIYAISNKYIDLEVGWGFRRKSEKKYRMRFHFLGFLKKRGSLFEGVHHIKKVSQNDGNGPMRNRS